MRLTWDRTAGPGQGSPAPAAAPPPATAPSATGQSATGQSAPAPSALAPVSDELDENVTRALRRRRQILRTLLIVFLVIPTVAVVEARGFTGRVLFLVPGTAVFLVLVDQVVAMSPAPGGWRRRWSPVLLALVVALGAALFAVGLMAWLTALAVAAAALGRLVRTPRLAAAGIATCAAFGLGISAALVPGYGNIFSATIVPALAGFLANSAERRNYLIHRLRETRAELARMAVAEERLRIARDLHDLLGHSLSLIALKAELAGRLLAADPDRAAGELADLETVARRSLTEVRQAVTSYRQPGLAAELAAGRRMLAAAGIDVRLDVPAAYSLPPAVDALLAWTVREGVTNIVRHAAARRACIRIELTRRYVRAELTNDSARPAPAGQAARGPAGSAALATGSGLAGLAERAASLGGTMSAGPREETGFRLRVEVPLAADGAPAAAGSEAVPLAADAPQVPASSQAAPLAADGAPAAAGSEAAPLAADGAPVPASSQAAPR